MQDRLSFAWIIPAFFTCDRVLKHLVLIRLEPGQSHPVWPGVFHLTRVGNTGAAFGLLHGAAGALAVVSGVTVAAILVYLLRGLRAHDRDARDTAAWAVIAAGALGNLYDRLHYGYVIDYLDFRFWPVFNLADAGICLGGAWLVWSCLIRRPARGRA